MQKLLLQPASIPIQARCSLFRTALTSTYQESERNGGKRLFYHRENDIKSVYLSHRFCFSVIILIIYCSIVSVIQTQNNKYILRKRKYRFCCSVIQKHFTNFMCIERYGRNVFESVHHSPSQRNLFIYYILCGARYCCFVLMNFQRIGEKFKSVWIFDLYFQVLFFPQNRMKIHSYIDI